MSDQAGSEILWHRDGHFFELQLNKHEIAIVNITCPDTEDRACKHEQAGCVVEWFLRRFGLDCNVGIAQPEPRMEIAWTLVGDTWDIDTCQVWVIPVNDEAFAAWLTTQS
jgi:hypothetical protein